MYPAHPPEYYENSAQLEREFAAATDAAEESVTAPDFAEELYEVSAFLLPAAREGDRELIGKIVIATLDAYIARLTAPREGHDSAHLPEAREAAVRVCVEVAAARRAGEAA